MTIKYRMAPLVTAKYCNNTEALVICFYSLKLSLHHYHLYI